MNFFDGRDFWFTPFHYSYGRFPICLYSIAMFATHALREQAVTTFTDYCKIWYMDAYGCVCKGFLMVKKLSGGTVCVFFLLGALSWNYQLSRKKKLIQMAGGSHSSHNFYMGMQNGKKKLKQPDFLFTPFNLVLPIC